MLVETGLDKPAKVFSMIKLGMVAGAMISSIGKTECKKNVL
jgi:hypothetical protein